jgi:hypothetical protein
MVAQLLGKDLHCTMLLTTNGITQFHGGLPYTSSRIDTPVKNQIKYADSICIGKVALPALGTI